jgi:hypothetical protein
VVTEQPEDETEAEDTPVAEPDAPAGSVPMSRFMESQKTVGALLAERERIMDALTELVNAAHPYRAQGIRLSHQPGISTAWENAYALCKKWSASKRQDAEDLAGPDEPTSPAG